MWEVEMLSIEITLKLSSLCLASSMIIVKKSIVESTNSYDSAISCLVARLEDRYLNLNPILQQMFLKLDSMERVDKKDFALNTLPHGFDDIIVEARKIFARYGCLGMYPDVHRTLIVMDENLRKYSSTTEKEEYVHIAIPFKLLGIAEALMDNFARISPKNLIHEASEPKKENKDGSQPCISLE